MEAKKIAAHAEVAQVGIAPHNPNGPLAGVAALHFAISTPNVVIQECMPGAVPWFRDVITSAVAMVDGHWAAPQAAGMGVDVNEREANKHPFKQELIHPQHAVAADGTIVDW